MTLTLRWYTAPSADHLHDDIQADLDTYELGCPGGGVVATVSQDADPSGSGKHWRWCVDDAWLLEDEDGREAVELASGYTATKQQARTAVMGWVRSQLGDCDCHPWPHTFRNDPDPCIDWREAHDNH